MEQRMIIGIDPDTHHTGIAVYSRERDKFLLLDIAKVPSKYSGEEAVALMARSMRKVMYHMFLTVLDSDAHIAVVEGQEVYIGGVPPKGLITLAHVAGAAICLVEEYASLVKIPSPKQWKGQVPKKIHNQRLLNNIGQSEDEVFKGSSIAKSQRNHVMDAMGLCLWGCKFM